MTEQIVEPSEAEVEAACRALSKTWGEPWQTWEEGAVNALQAAAKVRAQQEQR